MVFGAFFTLKGTLTDPSSDGPPPPLLGQMAKHYGMLHKGGVPSLHLQDGGRGTVEYHTRFMHTRSTGDHLQVAAVGQGVRGKWDQVW